MFLLYSTWRNDITAAINFDIAHTYRKKYCNTLRPAWGGGGGKFKNLIIATLINLFFDKIVIKFRFLRSFDRNHSAFRFVELAKVHDFHLLC